MVRIYLVLALIAVCLLVGSLILGFTGGDVAGKFKEMSAAQKTSRLLKQQLEDSDPRISAAAKRVTQLKNEAVPLFERLQLHRLLGILATLVTLLVNSISITYFIGTGRWCKEVVQTYSLDESFIEAVTQLKRKAFPWALTSILVTIGLVAIGASSDPIANPRSHDVWVLPHQWCAIIGTLVITWSFLVQVGCIGANYEIINQILGRVWKIRDERGLDKGKGGDQETGRQGDKEPEGKGGDKGTGRQGDKEPEPADRDQGSEEKEGRQE
ncbi:MAG: hypothetical protein IH991_10190 [Planctomycetes bacterium]|nr:hypothetical protein [Planctomycetota bacterium]